MSAKKISLFFLAPALLLGFLILFSPITAAVGNDVLIAQGQPLPPDEPNTQQDVNTAAGKLNSLQDTTQGQYGLVESTKNTPLIDNTPQQIVGTVIGAILSLLGVVFFLLIVYGGLRWMLAQGNEAEVEKAKEVLVAAVIGLIIVLSAYAITTFIGNQLTAAK